MHETTIRDWIRKRGFPKGLKRGPGTARWNKLERRVARAAAEASMNRHERRARDAQLRQARAKWVPQHIQICHDPEKTFVGLISNQRRYAWPVDVVPSIIAGLRACADGDPFPEVSKGMVFAVKNHTLVSVSDSSATAHYANINGEAAMQIDQPEWSFLQPPHRARELADGLEETLRKMAA
jgi:hypothetical protein